MYIQVHIIQTVPPSNANSDENGNPKHFEFGGSLRVTQSSQSQKYAARHWYHKHLPLDRATLASRSRAWDTPMMDMLTIGEDEEEKLWIARMILGLFNVKPEKLFDIALNGLDNLMFLANHEIEELASIAAEHEGMLLDMCDRIAKYKAHLDESKKGTFSKLPKKAEFKQLIKAIGDISESVPGDVALFGRMMASLPKTSVDGCVQVAFAVSVNSFRQQKTRDGWKFGQIDFFAANDDLKVEDPEETGAGMIGEKTYVAPTLYRYANVCVSEAVRLMGDAEAAEASVRAFLEGFIKTLPTGGGNSYAHQSLPEFILIEAGPQSPYNHAPAFETSIDAPEMGRSIGQLATAKLLERRAAMQTIYGTEPVYVGVTGLPGYAQNPIPLEQLIGDAIAATKGAE